MASPTSAQNGPSSNGLWSQIGPYAAPPVSAAGAIIPGFKYLIEKSAVQIGKPAASVPFVEGVREGIKASRSVGVAVGAQMAAQKVATRVLGGSEDLVTTLESSAIVGSISSPCLAILNGKTMKQGWRESLQKFRPGQAAAFAGRETGFVAGISAAEPVTKIAKEHFGDNKFVEYSAAVASATAGAVAGHPCDTAATCLQKNLPLPSVSQSMRGVVPRVKGIAIFAALYKAGKDALLPSK
ncbi:MAG: hypothetical protein JSS32_06385 [Verrucomicrobia bacterium]|nr:hypothetical protein [Verrucomicrobiota bacterium]